MKRPAHLTSAWIGLSRRTVLYWGISGILYFSKSFVSWMHARFICSDASIVSNAASSCCMPLAFHCKMSCLDPWYCLSSGGSAPRWFGTKSGRLLQKLHRQFTSRWRLSAWRRVEVTLLKWKWHRQEAHTSRLAPLLTFQEHSVHNAPQGSARLLHCRFQFKSSLPFAVINIVPLYDWRPHVRSTARAAMVAITDRLSFRTSQASTLQVPFFISIRADRPWVAFANTTLTYVAGRTPYRRCQGSN